MSKFNKTFAQTKKSIENNFNISFWLASFCLISGWLVLYFINFEAGIYLFVLSIISFQKMHYFALVYRLKGYDKVKKQ